MYCCVFIQADVLTEENEDEEAVEASEGNNGFFIKHGTFMGTENEQMASQASDMASSDSDYDTDLETEGNREKKNQHFDMKMKVLSALLFNHNFALLIDSSCVNSMSVYYF